MEEFSDLNMIARYGVGHKTPSYHDIREKLLEQKQWTKQMYSFKSTRMSGREQVAQLCLMDGRIRKEFQFVIFW